MERTAWQYFDQHAPSFHSSPEHPPVAIKVKRRNVMELMETMEKNDIREFFSKGWMTHDAMWFYHSIQSLGIEKANPINLAAVRSMAGIEMRRILKLMGRKAEPITVFETFKEVFSTAWKLVLPDFMNAYYSFPEKNLMRGGWRECFAYDGLKKIGAIDGYQCGIMVRIEGWIDSLGVKYTINPSVNGCLMHKTGKCEMDFTFNLD